METKVSFLKDNQKIEITYKGKIDPKKDGFILHTTGYDYAIGNDIIGFFDLGQYENINLEEFEKIRKQYENPITSGFSYYNVLDVISFYKRCVIEMDISMIKQYNETINKFDFFIAIN